MIYLDHAATTPLPEAVADTMYDVLRHQFGNPSAQYPLGREAKELVEELSEADISLKPKARPVEMSMESEQISLFDTVKDDDIITEIRDMDLGNMTPLDALNTIYRLQNKIKNRW